MQELVKTTMGTHQELATKVSASMDSGSVFSRSIRRHTPFVLP